MQLGHNVGALLSDSRHSLTQVILSSVSDLEKEQLLARWKGRVRQPCSFYGLCLHDVDQRLRKQGKGKIMIEVRFAVGLIGASNSLVGMVAFRVECQCFVVLGSGLCREISQLQWIFLRPLRHPPTVLDITMQHSYFRKPEAKKRYLAKHQQALAMAAFVQFC